MIGLIIGLVVIAAVVGICAYAIHADAKAAKAFPDDYDHFGG